MKRTITCDKCNGKGHVGLGLKCDKCGGEGKIVERVTETGGTRNTKILNE